MSTFCIQNGELVLPDRTIAGGTVILADGCIHYAGPECDTPRGAAEVDARGGYVTPGLMDVHIHGAGFVGWEDCTEEGLDQFRSTLLAHGILGFVPTMMADEAVIRRVTRLLAAAQPLCSSNAEVPDSLDGFQRPTGADEGLPGGSSQLAAAQPLYVEGPFINPKKRGGVQEEYIRPVDLAYLKELQCIAGGRIRMMTFAPELAGAEKLPAAMRELGIQPCVGHSLATAAEAAAVCGSGKICCTHLYNAMTGLDHRQPGLAAFGLNHEQAYVELNPDGTHVAPDLLQITRRAKRADRIVLISDAVISAGAEPGVYDYMSKKVRSTDRGVYYAESGTLIGSSILLNTGVQRFIQSSGAPVHEAVRMASLNPASLLGLGRHTGSLEPGKSADVVVFLRDFQQVSAVFCQGVAKLLNEREGGGP